MSTRRTSSGGQEHPTPKHVVRAVLAHLIETADSSSWAHFEVIAREGWFRNLLWGKEPWVEVAYVDEGWLQLNLSFSASKQVLIPEKPERWKLSAKGLWNVPISDSEALTDWVGGYLAAMSGRSQHQVSGWICG